jgi:hypothetical protein
MILTLLKRIKISGQMVYIGEIMFPEVVIKCNNYASIPDYES